MKRFTVKQLLEGSYFASEADYWKEYGELVAKLKGEISINADRFFDLKFTHPTYPAAYLLKTNIIPEKHLRLLFIDMAEEIILPILKKIGYGYNRSKAYLQAQKDLSNGKITEDDFWVIKKAFSYLRLDEDDSEYYGVKYDPMNEKVDEYVHDIHFFMVMEFVGSAAHDILGPLQQVEAFVSRYFKTEAEGWSYVLGKAKKYLLSGDF